MSDMRPLACQPGTGRHAQVADLPCRAANALKGKFEAKGGVRPEQYAVVALEAVRPSRQTLPVFDSCLAAAEGVHCSKYYHTAMQRAAC